MNQEEKEYLTRASKLLTTAGELAGDAVILLGATGRMTDAGQAEAAMFKLNNIARKIGYILDDLVQEEKWGQWDRLLRSSDGCTKLLADIDN